MGGETISAGGGCGALGADAGFTFITDVVPLPLPIDGFTNGLGLDSAELFPLPLDVPGFGTLNIGLEGIAEGLAGAADGFGVVDAIRFLPVMV